jgi:Ca-activated chloride channel family protein
LFNLRTVWSQGEKFQTNENHNWKLIKPKPINQFITLIVRLLCPCIAVNANQIGKRVKILRFLVGCLVLAASPVDAQNRCEVELVLALDVSRSVSVVEFNLISHGTANAFRDQSVINLVGWMQGGILVTVTQWSSARQQKQMVPWRHLHSPESLLAFADEIDEMRRPFRFDLTAPGSALVHAASMFETSPSKCRRQVIDISGDGVRNNGLGAGSVASDIAATGVTINGLVVLGAKPDPLPYYITDVVRGPASFVEVADDYDDFPRVMLQKLLRELTPSMSELQTTKKPG